MILKETIRSITVQFGESVLDDPSRLLGLLDDFGGFKDMEPERRKALREQIISGGVRQLLEVPKKEVRKIPKVNKTVQSKPKPPAAPVPQIPENTLTPKDWDSILKAMNATHRPSVKQRINAFFSGFRPQRQVKKTPPAKPLKVKKTKVKVVRAAAPKPVKLPRVRRERRKLTEEQKEAPAPSIQYHASNLNWQFVSYMILYMFQCHSPKSSHPLSHRVQKTVLHICVFFAVSYTGLSVSSF